MWGTPQKMGCGPAYTVRHFRKEEITERLRALVFQGQFLTVFLQRKKPIVVNIPLCPGTTVTLC